MKKYTELRYDGKIYKIFPDMNLICDIEDELGGIAVLAGRISGGCWKICEIVTITQMMMQAAGKLTDYQTLGNAMIRDGVALYADMVADFLHLTLGRSINEGENT